MKNAYLNMARPHRVKRGTRVRTRTARSQTVTIDYCQSDRERALNMPPREIKYRPPVPRGFSGEALRDMRKRHGVGRPRQVNIARIFKQLDR